MCKSNVGSHKATAEERKNVKRRIYLKEKKTWFRSSETFEVNYESCQTGNTLQKYFMGGKLS